MRILAVFIIITFLAFAASARPGGKIQQKNDDMQQDLRKYTLVYILNSI